MNMNNTYLHEAFKKIDRYPGKKVFLIGNHKYTADLLQTIKTVSDYYMYPVNELQRDFPKDKVLTKKDFKEDYVYIDAVSTDGTHTELSASLTEIFHTVKEMHCVRISLGVNTGCEGNLDHYAHGFFHSDVTIAMDIDYPFYHLRKDHRAFKELYTLSPLNTMTISDFFKNFPKKQENAFKGTYGNIGIVSGSYGMAGACALNILGARTLGAGYIDVCCTDDIYPVLAATNITPVFHPYNGYTKTDVLLPVCTSVKSICFGSGGKNIPDKSDVLDLILQNATCPIVLDAEGIRLLQQNYYILHFVKQPVILTPHIGEFGDLLNRTVYEVSKDKINLCLKFSKEYSVFMVLKGPNTIITSPKGQIYINESGNEGLAQAGSGDLLTGMITAMLSFQKDIFTALKMAVFLHGHIADTLALSHSRQTLDLTEYSSCMDNLFKENGY